MALNYNKYPHNWRKASWVIRRIAGYRCEQCGQPAHSVHHKGVAWATGDGWRPGRRSDKHDLRRENLISLCFSCHDFVDNGALTFYASLRARGQSKRRKHRTLNIGCGLIALKRVYFSWSTLACFHYALLRWSKRTGTNHFLLPSWAPSRVVDSYLVEVLA
jgi:hypothetical protein